MSILNAKRPENIKAHMLMSKKVLKIDRDTPVASVAQALTQHKLSSAPVLDKAGSVIGFITLGDCLKCLVNCLFHDHAIQKTAADVMTTNVVSASEETDLFELENLLVNRGIHDLPVINSDGELLGMISRRDAVAGIEKLYRDTNKYREELKTPLELTLCERMKYIARS